MVIQELGVVGKEIEHWELVLEYRNTLASPETVVELFCDDIQGLWRVRSEGLASGETTTADKAEVMMIFENIVRVDMQMHLGVED